MRISDVLQSRASERRHHQPRRHRARPDRRSLAEHNIGAVVVSDGTARWPASCPSATSSAGSHDGRPILDAPVARS